MKEWFGTDWDNLLSIVLTGIGIYIAILVFTRIAGKRSYSKMSSHDFAMTVALGSILASTVISKSISLIEGTVGLGVIYLLQMTGAILRRNNTFQKMVDNAPLLLMDGEEILEDNLLKARVTKSDLRSKLREANVLQRSDIRAVVFEATGDISVLHINDSDKKLEDWIMDGVEH